MACQGHSFRREAAMMGRCACQDSVPLGAVGFAELVRSPAAFPRSQRGEVARGPGASRYGLVPGP